MARNTANYTVTEEGRDQGKVFVLTEMPASRAESWAMRALLALMAGGIEVPEGFERMGMAAMAEIGIKALAGLKWEVAEPLLAEMWSCVQIMPDSSKPHIVRNLIEVHLTGRHRSFDRGKIGGLDSALVRPVDRCCVEFARQKLVRGSADIRCY